MYTILAIIFTIPGVVVFNDIANHHGINEWIGLNLAHPLGLMKILSIVTWVILIYCSVEFEDNIIALIVAMVSLLVLALSKGIQRH